MVLRARLTFSRVVSEAFAVHIRVGVVAVKVYVVEDGADQFLHAAKGGSAQSILDQVATPDGGGDHRTWR